jgi:hypothetical protein
MQPPIQLNNMVWEKAITHNVKKKRNPRKTVPKALKRAKAARASRSEEEYVLIPMADVHRAMGEYNRLQMYRTADQEWASWTDCVGLVAMESQWSPDEEEGYYRMKIRDKHAFMMACVRWGWSPQAANNLTKVSTTASDVGVDTITGVSSCTMHP